MVATARLTADFEPQLRWDVSGRITRYRDYLDRKEVYGQVK
jgi:hypothetical protein